MAKQTLPTPESTSEPAQSNIVINTGGAANQNTLRNIGLIIGREYTNRVKRRSFVISTIIILVLIAAAACVPTIIQYFTAKSSSPTKIAIINNAGAIGSFSGNTLTNYISANLNGTASQASGSATTGQSTSPTTHFVISTGSSADSSSLQQQVKNGTLNILLVIDRASDQSLHFTYYTHTSSTDDDTNVSQVQSLAGQLGFLDRAAHLGLTPAQTSSLFTAPGFTIVHTQQSQDNRSSTDRLAAYFISYAGVILILMSVFVYGIGVATGVAEEKGSRIMEILVNVTTPFQLMAGKIVGLGAAGLTQMVCVVVVGIGALMLQTPLQNALLGTTATGLSISVTGTSITMLLFVLLYFLLGFALYATLFAATGALVNRQDEVQNASQPITWLFMIGYIVSLAGGSTSSDAAWMKIISFIPFWTPTIMLMRIGNGNVAWWEIVLSIAIMLVAIFVCAVISARIYRYGILMYGQKPKLGQLTKIVRTR